MTIKEIFESVLTLSGQFNIGADCIELDEDKFLAIVKQCLGVYNRYSPYTKRFAIPILSSKQFTFTEESEVGIPDYITEIHPLRVSGFMPYYLREEIRVSPALNIKQEFPWEYRKPVLTVPVQAEYDVWGVFKHKLESETVAGKTTYSLNTISEIDDETFFDMLTGKFMIGLARSRRAFTLNALPITTDASELASDGKELFDGAKEELVENEMKFYLAWRP